MRGMTKRDDTGDGKEKLRSKHGGSTSYVHARSACVIHVGHVENACVYQLSERGRLNKVLVLILFTWSILLTHPKSLSCPKRMLYLSYLTSFSLVEPNLMYRASSEPQFRGLVKAANDTLDIAGEGGIPRYASWT